MSTIYTQQPTTSQKDFRNLAVPQPSTSWSALEKIAFRFFFVYFLLQIVPLDWKFYRDLLAIDWTELHFRDIFYLARYTPRFFGELPTFADWGVIALIAAAVTLVWSWLGRKRVAYNAQYYWLWVLLRYRLAAGVIAYGFIKFFPLQAPYPSLSNLNTSYGDFKAASTRRDREFAEAPKNEKRNRMILNYETKDGSRVILRGINESKDSVYVVLDRVNRQYALSESTLQAGKYE